MLIELIKTQRSFPLTIEHVRRMYGVGNFCERVLLSVATDLGLRIGDFIQIKKTDLPELSIEAPISFDVMTDKEDVVARGIFEPRNYQLANKIS